MAFLLLGIIVSSLTSGEGSSCVRTETNLSGSGNPSPAFAETFYGETTKRDPQRHRILQILATGRRSGAASRSFSYLRHRGSCPADWNGLKSRLHRPTDADAPGMLEFKRKRAEP